MQVFTPRDYQADATCQGAAQDARGILYVGNNSLVLEYDGSAWRKIPAAGAGRVAVLAYEAATDRVFVGGTAGLGYLEARPGGGRTFVSLLDQLPAGERAAGFVKAIYCTPEGVFFVSTDRVLRWREGRFKVWAMASANRVRSGWAAGHLYVQNADLGLLRLDGDAFAPASTDPLFRQTTVTALLDGPGGTTLIGTAHDGLFTLRDDGAAIPSPIALNGWLKEHGILQLLRLRDGSLAVLSDTAGLLLLDRDGRFRNHVDHAGGLRGNNLYSLSEDREGGLWIGLQSGITRAEIDSPLSTLRAGPGDDLSYLTMGDYCAGAMILGNESSLFRLVPADPAAATPAHLEAVPGGSGNFTFTGAVANGLLVASPGKIELLDASRRLTPVLTTPSQRQAVFVSRRHPGRVYVAEETGHIGTLRLDQPTGRWVADATVAELGGPIQLAGIVEVEGDVLWVGSYDRGLFRVQPGAGGEAPQITSFFDAPGPLHGVGYVYAEYDGEPLIFATENRLYRLDESGQNVRPVAEYGSRFVDGSFACKNVLSFEAGALWIIGHGANDPTGERVRARVAAARDGVAPTRRELPRKIDEVIGQIQAYIPLEIAPAPLRTMLIFGSVAGVVRLDVPRWKAEASPRPLATLIRRAVTANRSQWGAGEPPILHDALPYGRNSVHFEFAAGTLAFGAAPRFQTRLAGFDEGEWSEFGERASADYTNLPEGRYTFQVRARTVDGQLGSVASLDFRILPPWQRTGWAYAFYTLLAGLGVAALVGWRGRQLRRRNAALETLVAARTGELRGREAELVRARDDAESANRAKSAFLANMSHELRTPLNAILGYSQIIAKAADLPARTREQVQVIGQSGAHLLELINEVLDLAKVEAGKLTLTPSDFSLAQLLDAAAAAFQPRLAEKGLAFELIRAPGLPGVVHADVNRLRQVLFNLLANAVKFTGAGAVSLAASPAEGGRVRFEVRDTGVGIAADQLRAIFQAFHQTGESAQAAQGTGLGLAISQRLVHQMGGEIQVESVPGRGSRFWFDLPLNAADSSAMALANADGDPVDLPVTGYEGATRSLLVVDDQPENRRVLRDLLQPLGFEIEEAADGAGCLAACARRWPDAILLDLRLGNHRFDGFEVARTLRAQAAGRPLGIVAVSASVFEEARQQAIASGCDDFLPKPFEEARLLAALRRVLDLRWTQSGGAPPPPAPGEEDDGAAPPPEEVETLLELSAQGDVIGLRARLNALRAPGAPPGAAALGRALEPLVANYQMDQIHQTLLRFQRHGRR